MHRKYLESDKTIAKHLLSEMTTADVSEDETKDVEKEQNDHLKRKKK